MSVSVEEIQGRVEKLVHPIASELGLEVHEVEVRAHPTRGLVRVALDRRDAGGPGTGVTLEELARVSRQLGHLLEVEDPIPFGYHLEVTSPGIERELKRDRDFEKFLGARVRVVLRRPDAAGRAVFEGRLSGFDAAVVRVVEDGGGEASIERSSIRRAQNRFDFGGGAGVSARPSDNKGKGKGKKGQQAARSKGS